MTVGEGCSGENWATDFPDILGAWKLGLSTRHFIMMPYFADMDNAKVKTLVDLQLIGGTS